MIYNLLCLVAWGVADLFYKMGNNDNKDKNSYLKTGAIVGFVMGIHAIIYMIANRLSINFLDIVKYLPISFCYILSMVLGYKGLKYLELGISSTVQNSSGIITSILLIIFFKERYDLLTYFMIFVVFLGILVISFEENKEQKTFKLKINKKNITLLALLLPIAYSILDGAGTFLDGIYLDKLELISEDSALISYELTFLVYGIITYIFLRKKKDKISFKNDKNKLWAALFETAGQFFYVFGMAEDSVISSTVVGAYFILSLLLSRVFLKEKLSIITYIGIAITSIGIIVLSLIG